MGLRLRARQTIGEIAYRVRPHTLPSGSLSVLMYHAVTRENLRDPEQQSVSLQQFSDQMETLQGMGVRWVSLEEGLRLLKKGHGFGTLVSVVFDDGYVGVHDLALEVLVRYRIPATLFLATEQIGRSAFPDSSPRLGRPLTWSEVQFLIRETGCAIGSHGHSHRVLTWLSSEKIREELKTSRATIENRVNQACRLFAYPYGAAGTFDARTEGLLSEGGFTIVCTALWGRCRAEVHPLRLPRMRVSWCDTPHELEKSLAGCYDWYRLLQLLQPHRTL